MPNLRSGPEQLVNFRVETWVSSQSVDIDTIDSQTQNTVHVIEVENTTSVPRDCRVKGKLPNGTTYLSFDDGGNITDTWSKDISNLAAKGANDVRERHCSLRHVSEALRPEPVRCEEVCSKRGSGSWV